MEIVLRRAVIVIFCTLGLLGSKSFGQMSENLVTAQPGFYISSYVMYPGNFQVETNFTHSRLNLAPGAVATNTRVPNVLLRYGIADGFEVRLSGAISGEVLGGFATYLVPPTIEIKTRLLTESENVPGLALKAGFTIDALGTNPFKGPLNSDSPTILLAGQKSLAPKHTLYANFGMTWSVQNQGGTGLFGIAYEYAFAPKWVMFGEFYGNIFRDIFGPKVDAGVMYLISPNLQLDLSGGVGKQGDFNDSYISLGVSGRIVARKNR